MHPVSLSFFVACPQHWKKEGKTIRFPKQPPKMALPKLPRVKEKKRDVKMKAAAAIISFSGSSFSFIHLENWVSPASSSLFFRFQSHRPFLFSRKKRSAAAPPHMLGKSCLLFPSSPSFSFFPRAISPFPVPFPS